MFIRLQPIGRKSIKTLVNKFASKTFVGTENIKGESAAMSLL